MTEDEARIDILAEWRGLDDADKADERRVAVFCYRMADKYNFECQGDRMALIRSWVDQGRGVHRTGNFVKGARPGLMRVVCPYCGADAEAQLVGRSGHRSIFGDSVHQRCPIIAKRRKAADYTGTQGCVHLD